MSRRRDVSRSPAQWPSQRRVLAFLLLPALAWLACAAAPASVGQADALPSAPTVDDLAGQPIWSESAALSYLSEDGRVGFSVRVCRYPERRTTWVWVDVHEEGRTWSYNDNHLPGSGDETDLDANRVVYDLPGDPRVRLEREGEPGHQLGVRLGLSVLAHESGEAPEGRGTVRIRIDASMGPAQAARRLLHGRNETFAPVRATVRIGERELAWDGPGKWHEEHRRSPRWTEPFTYLAVSGDETSLLAVASRGRAGGFFRRGDEECEVAAFEIDPPGVERGFQVALKGCSPVRGLARRLRSFSVPIYSGRRPGTHVSVLLEGDGVEGAAKLIGLLNDYEPTWMEESR